MNANNSPTEIKEPVETDFTDEIVCPHCFEDQDTEITYNHMSLHGTEDGPKEDECESCGKSYVVKEYVSRNWGTYKSQEDYKKLA